MYWGAFVQPILERKSDKYCSTYSECLYVALVTQHAKRVRRIANWGLARSNVFFYIILYMCNACQTIDVMRIKFTYVFVLDRNFEILILVKPGRDRSVTTAKVSSTNQLEPGSNLIRSLYF